MKSGWNDFHKYKFVKEADVVDFARSECAKYNCGVIVRLKHDGLTMHMRGEKVGAQVELEAVLIDGDSEAEIAIPMAGYSEGKDDKGVFKSITGAKKYALMLLFNIATDDDPERHEKEKAAGAGRKAPTAASAASDPQNQPRDRDAEKRAKYQQQCMVYARQLGLSEEQRHAEIRKEFARSSITELTIDQLVIYGKTLKERVGLREMERAAAE